MTDKPSPDQDAQHRAREEAAARQRTEPKGLETPGLRMSPQLQRHLDDGGLRAQANGGPLPRRPGGGSSERQEHPHHHDRRLAGLDRRLERNDRRTGLDRRTAAEDRRQQDQAFDGADRRWRPDRREPGGNRRGDGNDRRNVDDRRNADSSNGLARRGGRQRFEGLRDSRAGQHDQPTESTSAPRTSVPVHEAGTKRLEEVGSDPDWRPPADLAQAEDGPLGAGPSRPKPSDESDRGQSTDESPRHAGSGERVGAAQVEPEERLGPATADPDGSAAAPVARGGERFAGTPEGPPDRTGTNGAPSDGGDRPPDPPSSGIEPGDPPHLPVRPAPSADGELIRTDTTTRRFIDVLANPDTADKIGLVLKPALELLGLNGIEADGLPSTLLGAANLAEARLDADYPNSPISENRDRDDPISRT